ncbi:MULTISPECIES: EamA family transporter [Ramlibacter]|uniref:EamA family transporter n=1 Tax=Ramlibacter aquaticus TaxID=2780094 RepID=A0ABR9SI52_9BURK|nr:MULTISPECIES: EamA family transporter [Ramlibacter]MBE7941417.1 EamA family transporter [Ramlibacter aquaticus]
MSVETPSALRPRDLAALATVVLIWGLNFVAMKVGLASLTPFQLGAGRFVFTFLPLALLVPRPALRVRWVLAFGAAQGLGQFGLLFVALQVGMTAALASVLLQTQVFFTALMGVLLLGERLGTPLRVGMGFAALGLGCFIANLALGSGARGVTAVGLALTLGSAAMWAVSNVVVRKAREDGGAFQPLSFVTWSGAVSVLPFLALSWLFDGLGAQANWGRAPWSAWLAVAALGWLSTNLAYSLWTGLLKRYPANRIAPFSLGVPVIGLASGVLVLGETVSTLQWLGAALVLAALVSVTLGPRLLARRARRALA